MAWGARLLFSLILAFGSSPAIAQTDDATKLKELDRQVAELHSRGNYAEAIPLAEEAVALAEKVYGPEHPDTAASLNNLAELYRLQGRYAEAEPLYKRALAIYEKALGPEHRYTATGLNNLAELYQSQGRYAEAEPLYKRALAIYEKALGPEHPYTATSLNNLARLYRQQGRYAEAEPLYKRALAIYEKALGPEHPDTATSLSNLALLYQSQGRYAEAEPLYKRALAIREKALGPEHPSTAVSLNNLAGLYWSQGRYAEAEPLYNRALAIREKALGPEHPSTAVSLNNLAGLYWSQGRYAEAEPLYKRALAIYEKALGPEHPDTAASLNNLALLYQSQGRYAEAEPLFKRALAIREKALGPEHPSTAVSLNNLAGLYDSQGRYAEAEPLYKRALAIYEKALGPEHPDTATSLNNLAELYRLQGRYAEAEPLYKRARAIREKALGPGHADTASSLNNLALLYQSQGRHAEAEPLYKRALAIHEKALGPKHPYTATSLNNLARLYRLQGRYAEAEPLYRRGLAIYEKALGPEHPDTVTSVENLAYLHRSLERWGSAANSFRATCSIRERRSAEFAVGCHAPLIDSLWRWSLKGGGATAADKPAALRAEGIAVAQRTGAVHTAGAFARGAAHAAAKRQNVDETAKRRDNLQGQLAALDSAFNSAAGRGGPEVARVLANLNAERDRLNTALARTEAELKAKAPDFFDLIKPELVGVEYLQATTGEKAEILRPDEAVILLVPGEDSRDKAFQRESLILSVSKTKIGWAALPKTVEIDDNAYTLEVAIKSLRAESVSGLGSTKEGPTSFNRSIAHALYKALFASSDEIRAVLDDPAIKTWVIAPQGMFISLPYATLVMEPPSGDSRDPETLRKTKWLGIERTLTIVPSVSSLAVQRLKLNPKSAVVARRSTRPEFLGFGDPDFARRGESRDTCPPTDEGDRSETPVLDRLFQGVNTNPKSVRELKRLPGTCREVKSLGEAFKAPKGNIVLGLRASEQGVRKHPRLSEARIIAFATHGLIAGSLQNTLAQPALAFTPPAEVQDQLPPIEDDGLLTTTDAATLDLQADWVLLSACDTAAKEGNDPDGLSGLARAFFYAGARSLLVSHWPVHDEAGMRLTTKAVELQAKDPSLTRPEAFRRSMQALIRNTSDPRFAHPAFWASFFIVSPE